MLSKLISQADATGKKLKTFVPANGVTVAEQDLVTSGGTTSEHLYFIHQDASGASAEQTDASGNLVSSIRAGEYDAMGRNVADASPYVSLNTEIPTDQGSGIDAFGSGDGFRPGRATYTRDGIPVPEEYYLMHRDGAAGEFGVLESSVTFLGYSIKYGNGDENFAGYTLDHAISRMESGETLIRNWAVNDNWAINFSIAMGPPPPPKWTVSDLVNGARKAIEDAVKNNPKGDCGKAV